MNDPSIDFRFDKQLPRDQASTIAKSADGLMAYSTM